MAHQRPLCGPRDDSRVSLALMPFRPFGGLRRPPAAMICKKASDRGVLRYMVRAVWGQSWSIKIIHLYTLAPKRRQIKGFPNGQKYSRQRQNDTPYSPPPQGGSGGGYTSSRIQYAALSLVPAHGPVPVMPHGPRRGVAAAGTGDVSAFPLRVWSSNCRFTASKRFK